jgi:hypothetical protein
MEKIFSAGGEDYSFEDGLWYCNGKKVCYTLFGSRDEKGFVPELKVGNIALAIVDLTDIIEASEGCLRLKEKRALVTISPITKVYKPLKYLYLERKMRI